MKEGQNLAIRDASGELNAFLPNKPPISDDSRIFIHPSSNEILLLCASSQTVRCSRGVRCSCATVNPTLSRAPSAVAPTSTKPLLMTYFSLLFGDLLDDFRMTRILGASILSDFLLFHSHDSPGVAPYSSARSGLSSTLLRRPQFRPWIPLGPFTGPTRAYSP